MECQISGSYGVQILVVHLDDGAAGLAPLHEEVEVLQTQCPVGERPRLAPVPTRPGFSPIKSERDRFTRNHM